jgi:molybdopterin-guanine dinucleotide biosynthesis protein A
VSEDAAHSPAPPCANCAFSAVLLAGGKSSRMGRDKAGILVDGRPLWERQLGILRRLGPAELFISGKPDGPYADAGLEIVPDLTPGCGPLSGLEASFRYATQPLVLVLAIDLPAMTAEFLSRLLSFAGAGDGGVIPRLDGRFEPLAAIYSRACLPLVQERLHSGDFSMRGFVREAIACQLVIPWELPPVDATCFVNVNTPADLDGL